jgi:hypothetical protein
VVAGPMCPLLDAEVVDMLWEQCIWVVIYRRAVPGAPIVGGPCHREWQEVSVLTDGYG